ncbi:serine acetyltransferase [Clostridium perfringens]|nr:serine acetyltransferase [Clostridium perfringens]
MRLIIQDFKFYKKNSFSKKSIAVLINPCFHAMLLYRISNWLYLNKLGFISKFIWLINRIIFNVDIDYRAKINGGVMLVHGLGVVIGSEVEIMSNVKIYQGVTIGGNNGQKLKYNNKIITQPVINENVTIGPNSNIFGPVIIHKNKFIKAGEIISSNLKNIN